MTRGVLVALAGAALLSASPVRAQNRAEGRVVRIAGNDTLAVPGAPVVLHRVGPDRQGPIDTTITARDGRFRFRFPPDTTATFLLSTRYAGIEYFSRPVAMATGIDTALTVIVADTSSAQPVSVAQRTILISQADESGTRIVLDWFVLRNAGTLTRVAPDSTRAAWSTPLPEAAQNVELADSRQSQFAVEALAFRGDSALVFAPISPGDKELLLQYRIPAGLRRFVVPARVDDSVFVLLEDRSARVVMPDMAVTDSQMIEGRLFHRLAGTMGGAPSVVIAVAAPLLSSGQVLFLLVAAVAVGFALLAWRLMRRRRARVREERVMSPSEIAAVIARLDAAHEGREGEVPAEEWRRYQMERARLREQLARALAAGRARS